MDLMEMRMRQQPLHWGADLLPERRVDIPVLPQVTSQARWKKFKNQRPHHNQKQGYDVFSPPKINIKLEKDQKKMLSQLPWSYADAVKKPNNKEANQPVAKDEIQMDDQNETHILKINESRANGEESDRDSQLNPDANEFIPVATSSDKDEMTASVTTTTTDNESEDMSDPMEENQSNSNVEKSIEINTVSGNEHTDIEMIDKVNGNIQANDTEINIEDKSAKINDTHTLQEEILFSICQNNLINEETKKDVNYDPFSPTTHQNGDYDSSALNGGSLNQFEENFVTASITDEQLNCGSIDKTSTFRNELNFDELVKNKTNYSDSHFSEKEVEADILDSSEELKTNGHLSDIMLEDKEINETYDLLKKYDNFNESNSPVKYEENETVSSSNEDLQELVAEEALSSNVTAEENPRNTCDDNSYQNISEKSPIILVEKVESDEIENEVVLQETEDTAEEDKKEIIDMEENSETNFYVNENFFSEENNSDFGGQERDIVSEQHSNNIDSDDQVAEEADKSIDYHDENKENIENIDNEEENKFSKQHLECTTDDSNDNESSFEIIPDGSDNYDNEQEQSLENQESDDNETDQKGTEILQEECFNSNWGSNKQTDVASNVEKINCGDNAIENDISLAGENRESNQTDLEQLMSENTCHLDEKQTSQPQTADNTHFTDSCDDITPAEDSVESELTLKAKLNSCNQEFTSTDTNEEILENMKQDDSNQHFVSETHHIEPLNVNEDHYTEKRTEFDQDDNIEETSGFVKQDNTVPDQKLCREEFENVESEVVEEELFTQKMLLPSSNEVLCSDNTEEISALISTDCSPLQETIIEKECENTEEHLEDVEEIHSEESIIPTQEEGNFSNNTEAISACLTLDQNLAAQDQIVEDLEHVEEIATEKEEIISTECTQNISVDVDVQTPLNDQNMIEEEQEFEINLDSNLSDHVEKIEENISDSRESQSPTLDIEVSQEVDPKDTTPDAVQELNIDEDISREENQSIASTKDACEELKPEEMPEVKEVEFLHQNDDVPTEFSQINEANSGSHNASELEEKLSTNELHSEEVCEAQEIEEENQFIDELAHDKNIEILSPANIIEADTKEIALLENYEEDISTKLTGENENCNEVSDEGTFVKTEGDLETQKEERNLETVKNASLSSPLIEESVETIEAYSSGIVAAEEVECVTAQEPKTTDLEKLEQTETTLPASLIAAATVTSVVAVGAIAATGKAMSKEADATSDNVLSIETSEVADIQKSTATEKKKPTVSSTKKTPLPTKPTEKPSSPVSPKSKTAVGKATPQLSKASAPPSSTQSKPVASSAKSQAVSKTASPIKSASPTTKPVATKAAVSPATATKSNASLSKATSGAKPVGAKPAVSATKSAASKPVSSATAKTATTSTTKLLSQTKTASPLKKPSSPTSSKSSTPTPAKSAASAKPAGTSMSKPVKNSITSKPAGANVSKVGESLTVKSMPLTKPSTTTTKPSTPTNKSTTSTKPATPKPTSAVGKSSPSATASPKTVANKPGSPTAKVGSTTPKIPASNAAKPSANKVSAERVATSKTSATTKPTTPPIKSASSKPTSAASKAAPTTKKPSSPVKQPLSVTSTGARPPSAKAAQKTSAPIKSAAVKGTDSNADKAKVTQNKTPANSVKKSPSTIKKTSTDKNDKNLNKTSAAPQKNSGVETKEEETVTSTTQDFPIENGLVIEDVPPQIAV